MIAKEVEDDKVVWVDIVSLHLEKLLHKANKDNEMLKHMANRYITRNNICNIRIKQLKKKHKQTLIKKKEEEKIEIIADAFLIA